MFSKIKTVTLSAIVALGTLAAIPATAQADSLYLNFGGHGAGFGLSVGHGHGWKNHHGRHAQRCTPQRALWKADRMGIRRAHVTNVRNRSIVVSGRSHGDRVRVVFGRAPHCPVIR